MPSANQLLFCTAPSIPLFIKVSCQIYTLIAYAYCMACCWMQVASQGLEKVWKKSTSFIARLCNLSYASDVSPQVMKRFDSKKRHFIVMLKLIHPTDRAVMKEPACFIGYAFWISIGCHASYPIRWWQAAFPMYMQSVTCHFKALMKRIRYEKSYIQTDGIWNLQTRQPYVQHFLYWFLIRDSTGILWVKDHLENETGSTSHIIFEDSLTISRSWFTS